MYQKLPKDKPKRSTIDQVEKGMWVDFVEAGARPQRMGYGYLSRKEKEDGSDPRTGYSIGALVTSAMYEALLMFSVSPFELPGRILGSMVPPVLDRFRIIHVDMMGPAVALFSLVTLIRFNLADKSHHFTPEAVVLSYVVVFTLITHILLRCCQGAVTLMQLLTLVGYSLYGPVFTLGFSLLVDNEKSNTVFFLCLAFFGGLSTLRVVLVILASLRIPAARLVICSLVALVQLLFVVFLHFSFLHPTFSYGRAGRKIEDLGMI